MKYILSFSGGGASMPQSKSKKAYGLAELHEILYAIARDALAWKKHIVIKCYIPKSIVATNCKLEYCNFIWNILKEQMVSAALMRENGSDTQKAVDYALSKISLIEGNNTIIMNGKQIINL